ncbi:MAG TPA: fibronectin type III domain-containing protein [Candidatus Acidoferrum sp.]|nr:fibronectin type III domain-containing protein [Candidatus Acidoferrum sp.]
MTQDSTLHGASRSRVMRIIWLVASLLVLFTAENIWVAPWLRNKLPRIPNLAPEPLSGFWFLALLAISVFTILLIVAQVLVALDRGIPLRKRVGTGLATLSAVLLCVLWARVTVGSSSVPQSQQSNRGHSVTLTWKESKSPVKGYNLYRATKSGGPYLRINPNLVLGLRYEDRDVKSGTTYYYMSRSVDADGLESVNSAETKARVP